LGRRGQGALSAALSADPAVPAPPRPPLGRVGATRAAPPRSEARGLPRPRPPDATGRSVRARARDPVARDLASERAVPPAPAAATPRARDERAASPHPPSKPPGGKARNRRVVPHDSAPSSEP